MEEPKKGCCEHTFPRISDTIGNRSQGNRYQSPIKSPIENCTVKKCKYAKAQAQQEFTNAQRLLDRIRYLKKSIQDLEISQQQYRLRDAGKKDTQSQTSDCTPPDLNSVREIVNNCIAEMTRLKEFLDDENCWWKMFKKREFNCCEQKLPHLHGFLDGTMVTLKMLEETLEPDQDAASTNSDFAAYLGSDKLNDQKIKYKEEYKDNRENYVKKFADSAIGPRQSHEFTDRKIDKSCQDHCPVSCTIVKHSSPIPGTSKIPDFEKIVKISETPMFDDSTTITKRDWMAKSSMDLRQGRLPSYTFSSENLARRHIIAADISTSMHLLPDVAYKNLTASSKDKDTVEKSFSLNPMKSFLRFPRSKGKRDQ